MLLGRWCVDASWLWLARQLSATLPWQVFCVQSTVQKHKPAVPHTGLWMSFTGWVRNNVLMYWSCLRCSQPAFNLERDHVGVAFNGNVLFHMWHQRQHWPKTILFQNGQCQLQMSAWLVWSKWPTAKSQATAGVIQHSCRDNGASFNRDLHCNTASDMISDEAQGKANFSLLKPL